MEWNKDSELFRLLVKKVCNELNVPLSFKNENFRLIYLMACSSLNERDFLSKIKLLTNITKDKKDKEEEDKKAWEVEIESEEDPILPPILRNSLKNN